MKRLMCFGLFIILNGCTFSKKNKDIIQKYIETAYIQCNFDQSSKLYSGLIFNKEVSKEISRCNNLFHIKSKRKKLRISSIELVSRDRKENPYYQVTLMGEGTYFKKFVTKMVRVIQVKNNSRSFKIYEDLSLREFIKLKEMNPQLI